MAGSGRFGKYGDLKRKEKIRQNRLPLSGHRGNLMADKPTKDPKGRKRAGGDKKRVL